MSNRDSHLCSRRSAFSMVEMLLVLIIIGVLSAVAVPRYAQTSTRQRLEAAVRRITTDLNMVRDRARYTSTAITVRFFTATHEYSIAAIEDPDHPGNIYRVSLFEEPYMTKIISANFGGLGKLTYDGYGEIETPGYIDVQVGNLSRRINIGDNSIVPVVIT